MLLAWPHLDNEKAGICVGSQDQQSVGDSLFLCGIGNFLHRYGVSLSAVPGVTEFQPVCPGL